MRLKLVGSRVLAAAAGVSLAAASLAQPNVTTLTNTYGARVRNASATSPAFADAAVDLSNPRAAIHIPAGNYFPFFKRESGVQAIPVAAFLLDASPVTQAQYLEFVRRHPEWRKSQIKALYAEPTYLADWVDDLHPGINNPNAPVTYVSWFAARSFCAESNGRLATVAEWERAAGAQSPVLAASNPRVMAASSADQGMPFRFAMGKQAPDLRKVPLHVGDIWEWTQDFNSAPISGSAEGGKYNSSLFCGDGYRSNNAADYAAFLRYSFRSSLRANYAVRNLGFRCAR